MCACVLAQAYILMHHMLPCMYTRMHTHMLACTYVQMHTHARTRTCTHTHAYTRLNTVHTALTHALTDIIIIIVVIVNAPAGNCTYIRCITSDELQGEHTVTLKSLEILSGLLLYTMNSIASNLQ